MEEPLNYLVLRIFIIAAGIVLCQCRITKIPVEVQVVEEDSVKQNIIVKIKSSDGLSFQLKLSKAPSIWSDNPELSFLKNVNDQIEIIRRPIKNPPLFYVNSQKHSVLNIDGNYVNGIVDDRHTIVFENGNHLIIKHSEPDSNVKDHLSNDIENSLKVSISKSSRIMNSDEQEETEIGNNKQEDSEKPKLIELERTKRMFSDKNICPPSAIKNHTINVFAIVDESLTKIINKMFHPIKFKNNVHILSFIGIYWAAIKQFFSPISWINIKLGDIFVDSESLFTASYMYKKGKRVIMGKKSLKNFGKFVRRNPEIFSSYDMVFLHTGDPIRYIRKIKVKSPTYLGGVCKRNANQSYGVAIAEEDGSINYINTASLFARNLGAPRDGEKKLGTDSCPGSEISLTGRRGKIPSNVDIYPTLSNCSQSKIYEYLNSEACSREYVIENRKDITIISSKYTDFNTQCISLTGIPWAQFKYPEDDEEICSKMVCTYRKNGKYMDGYVVYNTNKYPYDGTPCAGEKICIKGKCVLYDADKYDLPQPFKNFK